MNRRGFTLVELIACIAVIGLLASIALPKYQQLRKRAQAADVVGSMSALRTAAFTYNTSSGNWPPAAPMGRVPRGLAVYLPGGFQFRTADRSMGWRRVTARSGGARVRLQAIRVRFTDGVICRGVAGLLGGNGNPSLVVNCRRRGGNVTWLVDQ